jgi:hypothetical protein
MIPLSSKPNIITPNSTYPFGAIKDNPGDETGTPVNTKVYGDFHQFFEKLFNNSGLVANGLPDNANNGFQLFQALIYSGNKNFVSDIILGLIKSYTTNDLVILWGCEITGSITPGTANISQGAIFYNGIIYKVPAASINTTILETAIFKINNIVEPNIIYLTNGSTGTGIADYNSSNVKYLDYSEYNKASSSGNFEVTVSGTGCTATFDGAFYTYIKRGSLIDLKIEIALTISAIGGGNHFHNFTIITPTRAKATPSIFRPLTILRVVNDDYDGGVDGLISIDGSGNIITNYDNSFVNSARQYSYRLNIIYECQ